MRRLANAAMRFESMSSFNALNNKFKNISACMVVQISLMNLNLSNGKKPRDSTSFHCLPPPVRQESISLFSGHSFVSFGYIKIRTTDLHLDEITKKGQFPYVCAKVKLPWKIWLDLEREVQHREPDRSVH